MKRIVLFFISFYMIMSYKANAQIFTQVIDEQELQFKVKLIDEFFQRFNYEIDYKGEPVAMEADSFSVDNALKRKNLLTLFNLDKFAGKNNELDSIASDFLSYVIDNDKKINYADTTWQAEARASFLMNGKSYPIKLFLQTEHVKDVIYKWVITDVETPAFKNLTDTIETEVSIFPGAHGSSFMTLPATINLNAELIQALFHKEYKPDTLVLFAYLVSTGKIKLQNVTKVVYHFQLDDYNFTVERFEKENSYNQGWLISSIVKLKN